MKRAALLSLKILVWVGLFTAAAVWTHGFVRDKSGDWAGFGDSIARLQLLDWAVLGMLTLAFYTLDYVRYRSLLQVLGYSLTWPQGVELTSVSYFVSCLTPNSELHPPAMVVLLSRLGIPVSHALAATLTKSVLQVLWICIISFALFPAIGARELPHALELALAIGRGFFGGIGLFLLFISLFPSQTHAWLERLSLWPRIPAWIRARNIIPAMMRMVAAVEKLAGGRSRGSMLCHAASLAFVLVYATIGYHLAIRMGFELSVWQGLGIFSASLLVAYLAPVPGAIGVAEAVTAYLLDPRLSAPAWAVAVLLRVLCWYLPVPLGIVLTGKFIGLRRIASGSFAASDPTRLPDPGDHPGSG